MVVSTADRDRHRALAGEPRRRILEALRRSPLGTAELAQAVGLHVNTVRFHLRVLEAAGLVLRDAEPPGGPGRPAVLWRAVAEEAERGYETLSSLLADFVATSGASGRMREVGRRWGLRAGLPGTTEEPPLERLARFLGDLGFAPELHPSDPPRVLLHECPFRDVAAVHPEVVCAIHLGLVQGVLEASNAPLRAAALEPFVEPTICIAHVEVVDV